MRQKRNIFHIYRKNRTGHLPWCLKIGRGGNVRTNKPHLYRPRWRRWKPPVELPENYVNDKREYYRREYLKSDHWKQLKAAKLKKTPWCEECGGTKHLDVHHINYKNLYDVTLEDVETLCRWCHKAEHDKQKTSQN